jgi:hypothetical protein
MKKLCVLLNFMGCISSSFAANSTAQSHYDDCDQSLKAVAVTMPPDTNVDRSAAESVRAWLGALVTPKGSPSATSPTAAGLTSFAQVVKPLLPDGQQTPNKSPQYQPARSNVAVPELDNYPELRLYCSTTYQESGTLNPFTLNQLKISYEALSVGQSLYATFKPYVDLNPESVDKGISIFDSYEWLSNIRAWSKWWLNPWAWWDPSAYSLDEWDSVEWDEPNARVQINITSSKDATYLQSQLHQFLLEGWEARYAPYIVPATRVRLEEAMRLRFENVEKPALEAIGFKEVTLGARVNLTTQRLEYYVQGTK